MATDHFKVDLAFDLKPLWHDIPPMVQVRLDREMLWNAPLTQLKTFLFSQHIDPGVHALEIELLDKSDSDPYQALKIQKFSMGRIESPRFVWQAVYTPRYPEPWATQQKNQGIQLESHLHNTDYLGWNGIWRLQFDVPIFTWIHHIEKLGWIYH